MKIHHQWSGRVLIKYALLQIPGLILLALILLLLEERYKIGEWIIWLGIVIWIAKDIIIFPFVWPSYQRSQPADNPLIGETAVVQNRLNPDGLVRIRGELWKAELLDSGFAKEGEKVRIRQVEGLTLVVERIEQAP